MQTQKKTFFGLGFQQQGKRSESCLELRELRRSRDTFCLVSDVALCPLSGIRPYTHTPPVSLRCCVYSTCSPGRVSPEICDGCTMVNGVGYKAHWSACDLFVQCVIAADGSATVSIRQCPHGLHWDQAALTCNRPSLAACPQGEWSELLDAACMHTYYRM